MPINPCMSQIYRAFFFYLLSVFIESNYVFAQINSCKNGSAPIISNAKAILDFANNISNDGVKNLTCDLGLDKLLPDLIIIGEEHTSANSKTIKKELFNKAKEGDLILITEVALNSPAIVTDTPTYLFATNPELNSENIVGIESTLYTALTETYKLQNRLMTSEPTTVDLEVIAQSVHLFPIYRQALDELRRNKSFRGSIESIDIMNDWYEEVAKKGALNLTQYMQLRKLLSRSKISKKFFFEMHIRVINLANQNHTDQLMNSHLPYYLSEDDAKIVGLRPGDNSQFHRSGIMAKLLLDIRNRDFSEKIAQIICKNSIQNKQIVILLGDAHVLEVQSLLQGIVGRNFNAQVFQSYIAAQHKGILQAISKQK
jgi:hypothetical protein